jgi:HSP20 family protein
MLIRWSAHPAEQMVDSWRQFNRLFDEAYGWRNPGGNQGGRQGQWIPAAEVMEDERQFTLHLELPGLRPEEVKIDLEDDQLIISGEKRFENTEGGERNRRVERGRRTFRRMFTLPDSVDVENIDASLADGILTVNLPKTERAKPRSIQVRNTRGRIAGNGSNDQERQEQNENQPGPVEVRR